MAPPLLVIKIVKYCGVWGGGGPLSATKIEQYCGARGGGRQNPTKDNGAPLSVMKIVKYCGVGGGGEAVGALYKDNGAPSPCHQDS